MHGVASGATLSAAERAKPMSNEGIKEQVSPAEGQPRPWHVRPAHARRMLLRVLLLRVLLLRVRAPLQHPHPPWVHRVANPRTPSST